MKRPERTLPDTNTIIRYIVGHDPVHFAKAKDVFDKVKNGGSKAIVLASVVAECIYVLTKIYRVPKERAAASLMDLLH